MRRLLAIALTAAPLLVRGQTAGKISFSPSSVVNAAQCAVTSTDKTLKLLWNTQLVDPVAFPFSAGGEYQFYVSNTDHDAAVSPYCNTTSSGAVVANRIATDPSPWPADAQVPTTGMEIAPSAFAAKAGYDCSANGTIYACVLWYPQGETLPRGYAKAALSLKVQAPGKPTVTAVKSGNEALYVKASTPDGTTGEAADTWRAKAVSQADGTTHYSTETSVVAGEGTEVKISGLVNGVDYMVTAYSYSVDDNESPSSDETGPYSPQPGADAWDIYTQSGGREQGGCQSGGAGLLALVGAASLLGMRRRS